MSDLQADYGSDDIRRQLGWDELPEIDATPDEAFELGWIAGYDEAMREIARNGYRTNH